MTEIRLLSFGSPEHAATLVFRALVLREPDDPPFTAKEIGAEAADAHFALIEGGEVQASLVMTTRADGLIQMRQVAVHPDLRRLGLGRRLVEAAEAYARDNAFRAIVFYARPEAVSFYLALGYVEEAPWFSEIGVPDQMMAKRI